MTLRGLLLLALLWLAWHVLRPHLAALGGRGTDAPPAPNADDPYVVLGIARGASDEAIARAYRERMKEYHPDRVADLGPELRDLAHRKTVEIQRAWQAVRRR